MMHKCLHCKKVIIKAEKAVIKVVGYQYQETDIMLNKFRTMNDSKFVSKIVPVVWLD